MPKIVSLAAFLVSGALFGLPISASAMTPAPSVAVAGSAAANVEIVRMHRRMRHMRRGNPSARGWKKNF